MDKTRYYQFRVEWNLLSPAMEGFEQSTGFSIDAKTFLENILKGYSKNPEGFNKALIEAQKIAV